MQMKSVSAMTLVTLAASLRSIGAGGTRVGVGGIFACASLLLVNRLARNDVQPPFDRHVEEMSAPKPNARVVELCYMPQVYPTNCGQLTFVFAEGLECLMNETTHD